MVQDVSAVSQEQAAGVRQVSTSIEQVNLVTQRNSAAAEELASTAEELSSQAAALRQIMEGFLLDCDPDVALPSPGEPAAFDPMLRQARAPGL